MLKAVQWTRPAGVVPHLGREEAEARQQYYLGPEHLLVGLLRQADFLREVDPLGPGDDPAAELLRAHGLDLATVRAGIDRLVGQEVLPSPQLSDRELLASLGIDLDAVHERLEEEFGWEAWYDAARRLGMRPVQPVPHAPGPARRSPATGCSCGPARRRPPAARTSSRSTCCSACSATPNARSPRGSPPASSASAPCSASPTPARTRSSPWSKPRT
jgi:hypothetical protein